MVQSDIEKLLDGFASVAEDDTVEKVIQAAINLEQKVSGNSKLLQAVKSGRESLLEILIRAKGDRCGLALELAAMLGFDHVAKDLIAAGAAVSDRCLKFAVENGHADVLRSLLLSGVSIDDKCEKLLSDALRIGKKDIVKVLLEFGASIRDPDTRSSAIRHAVEDGNVDCVEALAVAGMLDSEDLNDLAELAVKKGHIDLYRYLLGMEWQKDQCSGRDVGESRQRLKSLLPFSDIINYAITNRTVSKRAMGSKILLDKHFPRASEICAIPGYGNVQKIPRDISRKCAKYCEKIIYESIDEENIRKYEFPLSLMRCGSSAEGTKVGLPDEMDFLFLLHTDAGKIVVKDIGEGYKIVEVPREHEDTLARKLISSGSKLFHDAFIGLVMTKKRHIDKIKSAQKIVTIGGSASSEWVLRYDIDADHSFDISVDLVPYVHIQGWPSDAVQSTWMMDSAALEAAGCALVAKPPHRSSAFGKKMKVVKQQRTWRISFAHLETRHLAMLEQRVKDVYITCKSLRDPDIGRVVFKDSNGLNISTSKDLVTSYMLKMVFMHNVAHFLQSRHTLAEMVYMVYNQLAECIDRWFVPFFWQPHVNVLEGLKHDPNRCKQAVKVMRSLATAWFIRDGMTDSVEEEDEKTGGVYPHLPTKTAAASRFTADHSPDEKTGSSEKDLDGDSASFGEDDEDDFYEVLIYSRNPCDVGYTLCQLE